MNKIILTITILLIATKASAGYFVFHDGETITGKRDSCGRVCSQRIDALRVDEATYNLTTIKFHKVVNEKVIEMTQQEKDVIIAAQAEAQALAKKTAIENGDITINQLLEALEDLSITTKKAITDEVKTNEGISLSP